MGIVIALLLITSIAIIGFSYTQRDNLKEMEQEIEHLSLSSMQEIYKMKKKMRVFEEEILSSGIDLSNKATPKTSIDFYTQNLILDEYEKGESIEEISKTTNTPVEEIKLIINKSERVLS
ncbi:hypothetical protein LC087_07520 [Bacillus carboniphilus]|uniref:Resolvase HTH domain-containing protein n=1 Tax=Bacillus carboniphilus TaxID=86663 RepID=A0ABY9JZM8_9BACI|nr:hypothetical protein [Bacillus carboniphilus]WLR43948.1 hypothetical protein LC087_07520 [Bacillus carboniphilus]